MMSGKYYLTRKEAQKNCGRYDLVCKVYYVRKPHKTPAKYFNWNKEKEIQEQGGEK